MDALYLIGIAVLALFTLVLAIVLFNFFGLWLRARIANAPVSLGKMIGMRLRKVPVGLIVDNRITAVKAGIDVRSDPLEAHYLAGGDVSHVVLALIVLVPSRKYCVGRRGVSSVSQPTSTTSGSVKSICSFSNRFAGLQDAPRPRRTAWLCGTSRITGLNFLFADTR